LCNPDVVWPTELGVDLLGRRAHDSSNAEHDLDELLRSSSIHPKGVAWLAVRRRGGNSERGIAVSNVSGETVGISRERVGEDLQRDLAVELSISRLPDLAHAAFAQGGVDLVGAEGRAILRPRGHRFQRPAQNYPYTAHIRLLKVCRLAQTHRLPVELPRRIDRHAKMD